ncbi:TlpA family protein disulfide reductase [Mycolicibacterium anyangense]|uniref:TlpA family protein disulfide reductase n=1 Tax=Mycolicibacterium anyangense TaxID=1431246 RepID=UPI0013CF7E48|nr:TlpA disulfide reductase family protein [Mycolicibacterium anyangense]
MTRSTIWTLVVLAVVAALVAAFVVELDDDPAAGGGPPSAQAARAHRDADTPAALAGPRQQADLPPCPSSPDNPGPARLRGIVVECAGDGVAVDVARAVAGQPTVLNLWAYWCGPCAEELPAMAEYQRRAGPDVRVITVHQDENETAALLRLADLKVRLPTLQDGQRRVAAALGVPNVMPATVVLRADGSVAAILPRAFTTADDIAAAVKNALQ